MLNEKFIFSFKITIKWNLRKSHATRLKSAYCLKYCLFLLKGGWSLLIRRLSINVTLKSLLLLARIEKSSNSGVWLQNKRCSLMAESSSPLILFPVSAGIPKCSQIPTLKWRLVLFFFYNNIYKWQKITSKIPKLRKQNNTISKT